MRHIIHDIDYNKKIIYLLFKEKKTGFYLTTKVARTFMPYLKKGVLVDFEISDKVKKIGSTRAHQLLYFNKIIQLKPMKTLYDIDKLRKDILKIFDDNKYYLFIDFEMTMPTYSSVHFISEIIQTGYLLAQPNKEAVESNAYYINAKYQEPLSKRTIKFLGIDLEKYDKEKKSFVEFYNDLKRIIEKYNPKIIVWGTNDIKVLNSSYEIHKLKPLTNRNDFIDLLKLHKNYYNVINDIGLFKAYETYYGESFVQTHDALDDAKVTKMIFDGFINFMRTTLK